MKVGHVVLAACPDYRKVEAESETSLKIDATPVSGEVGYDERRSPDLSDDLIVDTVCVLDAVNANRIVPGIHDSNLKPVPVGLVQ